MLKNTGAYQNILLDNTKEERVQKMNAVKRFDR